LAASPLVFPPKGRKIRLLSCLSPLGAMAGGERARGAPPAIPQVRKWRFGLLTGVICETSGRQRRSLQ